MTNSTLFRSNIFGRSISVLILWAFLLSAVCPPAGYAQTLGLTLPAAMIGPSQAFLPTVIKGLRIDQQNLLQFNFIVDTGDTGIQGDELKDESTKLIKYFLAALTTPDKDMWVNLSPTEKDRIIPDGLGSTEMGRDLLSQDYLLKQLTASLMYPESELGERFWKTVYAKIKEQYGTTELPVDTLNKVWIVPDKAVVCEHEETAFVVEKHLKVMMEGEYKSGQWSVISDQKKENLTQPLTTEHLPLTTQIIKEIIIPAIEHEVNTGRNFAQLRQIYNSMILATWYKRRLKESLLGQLYVDQNKTKGIDLEDKDVKYKIYNQYLEAFKKGAYDYIKEDYDPVAQEVVTRKYISGGMAYDAAMVAIVTPDKLDSAQRAEMSADDGKTWSVGGVYVENGDAAILAEDEAAAKERDMREFEEKIVRFRNLNMAHQIIPLIVPDVFKVIAERKSTLISQLWEDIDDQLQLSAAEIGDISSKTKYVLKDYGSKEGIQTIHMWRKMSFDKMIKIPRAVALITEGPKSEWLREFNKDTFFEGITVDINGHYDVDQFVSKVMTLVNKLSSSGLFQKASNPEVWDKVYSYYAPNNPVWEYYNKVPDLLTREHVVLREELEKERSAISDVEGGKTDAASSAEEQPSTDELARRGKQIKEQLSSELRHEFGNVIYFIASSLDVLAPVESPNKKLEALSAEYFDSGLDNNWKELTKKIEISSGNQDGTEKAEPISDVQMAQIFDEYKERVSTWSKEVYEELKFFPEGSDGQSIMRLLQFFNLFLSRAFDRGIVYDTPLSTLKELINDAFVPLKYYSIFSKSLNSRLDKKIVLDDLQSAEDTPQYFDKLRLLQIFMNLYKNAIEAMDNGGTLTIMTETVNEGKTNRIIIKDTGTGIPLDILPKIFVKGETFGKVGGTGLGLALVKEYIEAMGGTIEVESKGHILRMDGEIEKKGEEGIGTAFTIELPVRHSAEETFDQAQSDALTDVQKEGLKRFDAELSAEIQEVFIAILENETLLNAAHEGKLTVTLFRKEDKRIRGDKEAVLKTLASKGYLDDGKKIGRATYYRLLEKGELFQNILTNTNMKKLIENEKSILNAYRILRGGARKIDEKVTELKLRELVQNMSRWVEQEGNSRYEKISKIQVDSEREAAYEQFIQDILKEFGNDYRNNFETIRTVVFQLSEYENYEGLSIQENGELETFPHKESLVYDVIDKWGKQVGELITLFQFDGSFIKYIEKADKNYLYRIKNGLKKAEDYFVFLDHIQSPESIPADFQIFKESEGFPENTYKLFLKPLVEIYSYLLKNEKQNSDQASLAAGKPKEELNVLSRDKGIFSNQPADAVSLKSKLANDAAMGAVNAPGGIDFNSELLDLQIKRDGNGVPLPLPQQPIENMHIDGFFPVITTITPVRNVPALLGMLVKEN